MQVAVHTTIERPMLQVKALMADESKTSKWMRDLVSTAPSDSGKTRLTFKNGMIFESSPLKPANSSQLRIHLISKNLVIITTAQFTELAPQKTELTFSQHFTFSGIGKIFSFLLLPAIKKQQQQHVQDFKNFALQYVQ